MQKICVDCDRLNKCRFTEQPRGYMECKPGFSNEKYKKDRANMRKTTLGRMGLHNL